MRHLLVCPEYPPAPGGGIGTYGERIARVLAERGETVHVIARATGWAKPPAQQQCEGGVVIHRIPNRPWNAWKLVRSHLPEQTFAWHAALLAEEIIAEEHIDVIEAQEYSAPLYWFQQRRARGHGPARRPPCVVHLHSPSLLIARHNGARATPYLRTTLRMESFSIRAADAVIAPSNELMHWAQAYYRLREKPLRVIPYPGCSGAPLERDVQTWSNGTVCYVGRLERRKGVLDWTRAAVQVAEEFSRQHFEFVGADTTDSDGSVYRRLESRIPRHMRGRFEFAGAVPRGDLPAFLRRARIAAVPSRWDNFPNVCVEAMSSGLPVIGTRTGGIAEMVQPGRSGWLAEAGSSGQLACALRAALSTPAERLAEMGAMAARDIGALTDPGRIFDEQMALCTVLCT